MPIWELQPFEQRDGHLGVAGSIHGKQDAHIPGFLAGPTGLPPHQQYRTGRVTQYPLPDAAEKKSFHARQPFGAHHNQVNLMLFNRRENLSAGDTFNDIGLNLQPLTVERIRHTADNPIGFGCRSCPASGKFFLKSLNITKEGPLGPLFQVKHVQK